VGLGHLGGQAWEASVDYAANRGNPYVYAQTSPNILELVDKVTALANVSPEGRHLLIKVIAPEDDYWPLPWYLRRFNHVGWWGQVPTDPFAPLTIISTRLEANLSDAKSHVRTSIFELRPGAFFTLYVEADLWKAYLDKKPAAQNPD
jgi:predicted membrane-bound mannosyltransferase